MTGYLLLALAIGLAVIALGGTALTFGAFLAWLLGGR